MSQSATGQPEKASTNHTALFSDVCDEGGSVVVITTLEKETRTDGRIRNGDGRFLRDM